MHSRTGRQRERERRTLGPRRGKRPPRRRRTRRRYPPWGRRRAGISEWNRRRRCLARRIRQRGRRTAEFRQGRCHALCDRRRERRPCRRRPRKRLPLWGGRRDRLAARRRPGRRLQRKRARIAHLVRESMICTARLRPSERRHEPFLDQGFCALGGQRPQRSPLGFLEPPTQVERTS